MSAVSCQLSATRRPLVVVAVDEAGHRRSELHLGGTLHCRLVALISRLSSLVAEACLGGWLRISSVLLKPVRGCGRQGGAVLPRSPCDLSDHGLPFWSL